MSNQRNDGGQVITTAAEVMAAIDSGCRVYCEWKQRQPMLTMPGEVIRCQGNRVMIRHWSDSWHVVGEPGFTLVAHQPKWPGGGWSGIKSMIEYDLQSRIVPYGND